jgi:Peptidase family M20/M25/M40
MRYDRGYPVTVNDPDATRGAARAAALVVGDEGVERNPTPSMGSEDFAFMLRERPGCYVWLGSGSADGGCVLHNPRYDFNDDPADRCELLDHARRNATPDRLILRVPAQAASRVLRAAAQQSGVGKLS